MAWRIQITGTTAQVTTAVNALSVPASDGATAASQLAAAKVYILNRLTTGAALVVAGPVRLVAEGNGQGNGSFLNVDLVYVRVKPDNKIIEPPPTR